MQNTYSNEIEAPAKQVSPDGTQDSSAQRKRIGRPPKIAGATLEAISLSLPPSMIEQMKSEQAAQGVDSVSAVARLAIGDFLRRLDKRRARMD